MCILFTLEKTHAIIFFFRNVKKKTLNLKNDHDDIPSNFTLASGPWLYESMETNKYVWKHTTYIFIIISFNCKQFEQVKLAKSISISFCSFSQPVSFRQVKYSWWFGCIKKLIMMTTTSWHSWKSKYSLICFCFCTFSKVGWTIYSVSIIVILIYQN